MYWLKFWRRRKRIEGRRRPWLGLLLGAAVTIGVLKGNGDTVGQEPQKGSVPAIVAQVDLVNVEVSVTNARGDFVAGLKRENFRILDNGVEQPITHFAPTEDPAQVLMLVETSPAVYLIHKQHLAAAQALLGNLAANDRVAVATYDQFIRLATNFSEDKRAPADTLLGLRYSLGSSQLNLYEALSTALDWLGNEEKKKAIVLLSTGLDTSGHGTWQKLAAKLLGRRVVVFPVALGGELRRPGQRNAKSKNAPEQQGEESELSFARADRALREIAEMTGGKTYVPRDGNEFAAIYQQIARRLRNQYSLGFLPPARDGRTHRLEVQVVGTGTTCGGFKKLRREKGIESAPNDCRVQNRREYLAPTQ